MALVRICLGHFTKAHLLKDRNETRRGFRPSHVSILMRFVKEGTHKYQGIYVP